MNSEESFFLSNSAEDLISAKRTHLRSMSRRIRSFSENIKRTVFSAEMRTISLTSRARVFAANVSHSSKNDPINYYDRLTRFIT